MSSKSRDKNIIREASSAKRVAKVNASAKTGKKTVAKTTAKAPAKKAAKSAKAISAAGDQHAINEGDKAPAFSVMRDDGGTVSLANFEGRNLVVFFYPRADTPGCTTEAKDFTRLAAAFEKANTALLGVSADPVKTQARFRDKHKLAMPLGSDETQTMLSSFGAWGEKSMYGRKFLGVLRTTVLIDGKGRIARFWRNVKVEGHADDVLAAATALS